jgi:uncharacterized protein
MDFRGAEGFDWDVGNSTKNFKKHGVTNEECEQVFSNTPFYNFDDVKHSAVEQREIIFGQTDSGKQLFIAFTMRNNHIRVISARALNKDEREKLNQYAEKNT